MTETTVKSINFPSELLNQAELILSRLGFTVEEAATRFFNEIIVREDLPFEVLVPNAETLEAMQEADDMINGRIPYPPYQSTKDFIEELRTLQ